MSKDADKLWAELLGVYSRTQKNETVNNFGENNQVITKEQYETRKLIKHINKNKP